MPQVVDPLNLVRELCERYGVDGDDLLVLAQQLGRPRPTVAEAAAILRLPDWISQPPNDLSLRRLVQGQPAGPAYGVLLPEVTGFAARAITAVTGDDLTEAMRQVQRRAGLLVVARAARTGRPLSSYIPEDHGRGAARNYRQAAQRFFTQAQKQGLRQDNPAADIATLDLTRERRPLSQEEVRRLQRYISVASADPALDRLLVDFFLASGARTGLKYKAPGVYSQGLLTTTVDAVLPAQCLLRTRQKYSTIHERPVRRSLLLTALRLAYARGACTGRDRLFRTTHGRPVTRRHLDTLFGHAQRDRVWQGHLPVSAHWLRTTCLERLRVFADERLSSAWAGHSAKSSPFATTEVYWSRVTQDDFRQAAERAFGPLEDCPVDLRGTPLA